MLHLLIDADTGVDDSIAILYALLHPEVHVAGITTGCGNTSADQAAENTLRLIQLARPGYEVPVVVGANAPLSGVWEGPMPHIHGENGIGGAQLPPSPQRVLEEDCSAFLYRMAEAYSGELTVLTLGRMTNLAAALRRFPELKRHLRRVVAMGGTLSCPGNVSPRAEANLAGDPEAADEVFSSGLDLTMVGLDVTERVRLRLAHLDAAERSCPPERRPVLDYMRSALGLYLDFTRFAEGSLENCPLHDPLAAIAAVRPEFFLTRRMRARVELGGTWCRGQVVTDLRFRPFEAEYVNFCVEVDGDQAIRELFSVLCGAESMG